MSAPRLYTNLAVYYDRLESQYRDYAAESKWLFSLISSAKASRVLDVSCGTARHVAALSAMEELSAVEILAMDSSPDMIDIAKTKFPRSQDPPVLLVSDFLRCPFARDTFDIAFCMYWSLAGLDEAAVEKLFREVSRILRKGGLFVFDVENAEGIKENLVGKPFIDAFFFDEVKNCLVMRVNISEKIENDAVDWKAFYIFSWDTLSQLVADRMTLRFYTRATLERMLAKTGFAGVTVSSTPFGKYVEHSPTLYVVARKA